MAFLTLFERKIISLFHYRKGPNKVGILGLLQPFRDALKLLTKELFFPNKSSAYLYLMSPILSLSLTIIIWLIYPFLTNLLNFKLNSFYFLCLISMGVYGLLIIGWASNSIFSMIGAIRSIAQSISYEVTFRISLLIIIMIINSLNISNFNFFHTIPILLVFLPPGLILLISILAEINRTPFDLSEGESELVSGFNVEYASRKFTIIFLAEYARLILIIFLFTIIILNNNLNLIFYANFIIIIFMITWVRITLPRIRYDKLITLCWFTILPIILILYIIFITSIKIYIDTILN